MERGANNEILEVFAKIDFVNGICFGLHAKYVPIPISLRVYSYYEGKYVFPKVSSVKFKFDITHN